VKRVVVKSTAAKGYHPLSRPESQGALETFEMDIQDFDMGVDFAGGDS
jgi:hypothetical protein